MDVIKVLKAEDFKSGKVVNFWTEYYVPGVSRNIVRKEKCNGIKNIKVEAYNEKDIVILHNDGYNERLIKISIEEAISDFEPFVAIKESLFNRKQRFESLKEKIKNKIS